MWDDLNRRLGQAEARLREARRLLAEQRTRAGDVVPGEMLEAIARAVVTVQEADRATEVFCQALRTAAEKDQQARRSWSFNHEMVADLYRALGIEEPGKPSLPRPEKDDPEPPQEGGLGNAPVGAIPKPPRPLVGAGAAKTFEEAAEPPRNP